MRRGCAGFRYSIFATWMERGTEASRSNRYKIFGEAVLTAQAQAIADHVALLRRAARKGKGSAAWRWLSSQCPQHFPPTTRLALTLNSNTTLLAQIKTVQEASAAVVDPRELLEREMLEQRQPQALPEPESQAPVALAFEPNVISDMAPNVVEMIRALPD